MENKLKSLRQENNLSQKDVAIATGITTSYYGMIEVGARKPSLLVAKKLASVFNVTIDDIFFAYQNN